MFLIKVLAFFDMFAGILLLLSPSFVPFRLLFGHGLYLMIKGYVFKGDFLSAVDFVIGVYCVIALFLPIKILSISAGLFLVVKGIYSFVG
ncbi:MAG: hypothetical protein AB7V77_05360 [Candidatus Woesearchaeota archaeon]